MYAWQVYNINTSSYIDNNVILSVKVPKDNQKNELTEIELNELNKLNELSELDELMNRLLIKAPKYLHLDLLNIVWMNDYIAKKYVLKLMHEMSEDSLDFVLKYLKDKDKNDQVLALNMFLLDKKIS
uniref:Uncharacterized protein n=1 Tax=viral metagenome TaxID=1070528 RepID=A0A6C0M040_9ZZZZ